MKGGLKKLIASIAPTLATALGGPFAGTAVKILAKKFLNKDDATEDELEDAIGSATPEELGVLKKIDNDFKLEMGKQKIDLFALEISDVQNSRELFKINMWPQVTLSAFYTVGYFTIVFMLLSGDLAVPEGSEGHLISGLIGVLTTMQVKIADFWFGSSHGSKTKG